MSEEGDYTDKYKLYGVVVHLDMLNASFFGHYICYIKDLQGNWYRIGDYKMPQNVKCCFLDMHAACTYLTPYTERVSPRATCLKTFEAPKKREYLDRSAMEVEQHRPGNNINSKEDTTSSPLSRDVQDHKDGAICSYVTSVLGRHTHTETSSLISFLSEAHTITSEPFTKGFRVESKCSTSNGSLASDDTSYEMQQVRNPIHFLEPGHKFEDIKYENDTLASCTSQSSVDEEDESPLTLDTPGSVSDMNGNCKIIVAADSPNKCVVAKPETRKPETRNPIILDHIALENDSRKLGHNFQNINSQTNVSISSSSQAPVVEKDGSPLTLDAQGATADMNGN